MLSPGTADEIARPLSEKVRVPMERLPENAPTDVGAKVMVKLMELPGPPGFSETLAAGRPAALKPIPETVIEEIVTALAEVDGLEMLKVKTELAPLPGTT